MIKEKTCCFTGHRPKNLPWKYDESNKNCSKFKIDLKNIIKGSIHYGIDTFLVGMAEGFDMIAAEIIISLKPEINHIKLYACIPCKNQEIKWNKVQQERYHNILKQCDNIIILQDSYTADCMQNRNKFMIDNSSIVIGCYTGKPSGTHNTLKYAKEKNCKIKLINPENYK